MNQLQPVEDQADWSGQQLEAEDRWRHQLSDAEVHGLVQMARDIAPQLNNSADALQKLSLDAFDPGPLSISQLYNELKNGCGVVLLRGLPADQLSPLELAIIYWGIGRHLGDAMPNNPDGDLIGHVTDLGKTQADANSRGYQTREAMDYHCDQADIVGLLCVRTARSGGVSRVASSVTMYNTLLRDYPDYAQALAEPLCWSKHGEHAADEAPYYESPVFNFLQGRLCTSFGPKHIIKGHDLPQTPPLSELVRSAIDTAESITHQQRLEMTLEPGDMQFLNNYVTLHTRSAYEDHEDPAQKRLLWRLWLMNDDLRSRTGYSMQWQQGVQLGQQRARIVI
jgi:hypothetical protein